MSWSGTSSPVAALTSLAPPRDIDEVPFTMGTKSASPGMYAVPAAQGPSIAATCGTTPDITTWSAKSQPLPANVDPAPANRRPRAPRLGAARRVEQPHDRLAITERQLAHARRLELLADRAHRTGH